MLTKHLFNGPSWQGGVTAISNQGGARALEDYDGAIGKPEPDGADGFWEGGGCWRVQVKDRREPREGGVIVWRSGGHGGPIRSYWSETPGLDW